MDHKFSIDYNISENLYRVYYYGITEKDQPESTVPKEEFDITFKNMVDAEQFCRKVALLREPTAPSSKTTFVVSL